MILQSRNNIISIYSDSVILKAKPSIKTRCRSPASINHGRNRIAKHKQGVKRIQTDKLHLTVELNNKLNRKASR